MTRKIWLLMVFVNLSAAGEWEHVQGEMHPEDYDPGACIASTKKPMKPRPLEFCSWHLKESCCLPMHDVDAQTAFADLTDLGMPCSRSEHKTKHNYLRLRYWNCLVCDPMEPSYRYNVYDGYPPNNIAPVPMPPYSLSVVLGSTSYAFMSAGTANGSAVWTGPSLGDSLWYNTATSRWEVVLGGQVTESEVSYVSRPEMATWGAGASVERDEYAPVKFSWRVCQSFMTAVWNGSGYPSQLNGGLYDACGMKVFGLNIIPSAWYQGETAAYDFLSAITPPGFGTMGFTFTVVDDFANDTQCQACTVSNNMCLGCPNGCTYNLQTSQCEGFRKSVTPCFAGEGTPLPAQPNGQAAAKLNLLFFTLLLLIIVL